MKVALIAVFLVAGLLSACQQGEQVSAGCTDEIIIEISPASATLLPGETMQASYQLFSCQRFEGIPANPTWTSNNPDIATVNATGLVTAVAAGKTDVVIDDKEHSIVMRIPIVVVAEDPVP